MEWDMDGTILFCTSIRNERSATTIRCKLRREREEEDKRMLWGVSGDDRVGVDRSG